MSDALRFRWLPNAVSIVRVLLIAPLIAAIVTHHRRFALWIIIVAALTDGLDGFLAKRFDWRTPLGAILDPAADKLLLSGAFAALVVAGRAPAWLFALVVLRDGVISVGAYAYRRIMGRLTVRPTRVSKMNTVVQFLYVVLLLAQDVEWRLGPWWIAFATGGVAVSTMLSGIDYVWAYGLPALGILRERARGFEGP